MAGEKDLDELLRPTLTARTPDTRPATRPWAVGSQVYVAFFGGVFAVTAIAALNARRLEMSSRQQAAVIGCGVLGLAVLIAVETIVEPERGVIVARIVALAAYGGMWLLQRVPERIYLFHTKLDEPHDSLWGPGIAAVIAGAILQGALVVAIGGGVG